MSLLLPLFNIIFVFMFSFFIIFVSHFIYKSFICKQNQLFYDVRPSSVYFAYTPPTFSTTTSVITRMCAVAELRYSSSAVIIKQIYETQMKLKTLHRHERFMKLKTPHRHERFIAKCNSTRPTVIQSRKNLA